MRAPLSRDIGPPPSYLAPVDVPAPAPGDSVLVDRDRNRAGLERANCIIVSTRREWDATRQAFRVGRVREQRAVACGRQRR